MLPTDIFKNDNYNYLIKRIILCQQVSQSNKRYNTVMTTR